MEWLFTRCADEWAHASARRHAWRGLALYGVDGSTLRIPDSDENRATFGGSSGERGQSGYPLVRMAALMGLRSHLLAAASFGPYGQSELSYAAALWQSVPSDSLTIMDRNFLAAPVLIPLHRDGSNRHWLTRAKTKTVRHVIERLGPGDELVELETSPESLQNDPALPRRYRARAIRYQRKGFEPQVLLTSLVDAKAYPASEIVGLYHERWEIELGYDEIKTEMLDREEAIRSKTPDGVRQELWGILLAYNLIRLGDGAGSGCGQGRADPHQLRQRHAAYLRRMALVRHRLARSHSQEPPQPTKGAHGPRLAPETFRTQLSQSRENQDE